MVISLQTAKGLELRNSMPFLWAITESGESDRQVCWASNLTSGKDPLLALLLALIQQY